MIHPRLIKKAQVEIQAIVLLRVNRIIRTIMVYKPRLLQMTHQLASAQVLSGARSSVGRAHESW